MMSPWTVGTKAEPVLSPDTGFTVTSHQLSLYGTCETCS